MKNKILSVVLAAVLILAVMAVPAVCMADTVTIKETVNISNARQNIRGHGYEWENIPDILTLSGIRIETKDDYGIKLPANCTVVLKGNNYIKAGKYGISCAGKTLFKGNGTLTIDAGEIGIYLFSQDSTTKIQMLEGKYVISAGKYGVFSEYSDFSVSGAEFEISVPDGRGILGRTVNLVGGSIKSDSSIEATQSLLVDGVDVNVVSNDEALISGKLSVRNVSMSCGDEYGGENEITFSAQKRWHAKSILLGDNVPGWADYILLAAGLILVAACIVIPVLRKRKKKKELYERLVREGFCTEAEAAEKLRN